MTTPNLRPSQWMLLAKLCRAMHERLPNGQLKSEVHELADVLDISVEEMLLKEKS